MSWNIYYPPGGAAHHLVYQSVQFIEFSALATLGLAAGSMFLVWLGDQITEFGIGQGVSIIIMLGIVSRFPPAIANMFLSNTSEGGIQVFTGMAYVAFLLVIFLVVILGIVLITLAHRRIPLQVARHVRGPRSYGGIRQYIPIKVNHANVMPIIFAQALMIIPTTMLPLVLGNQVAYWFSSGSFLYAMIYIILIVFFCFFWNAISLNPKDMAENLKNSGQFIPGIRPGEKTREYLSGVITRVTTVGAFFITLIALIPMIITSIFNLDMGMASALFSGSGLLIVVGVALDMVQKVEAQLAQRHYQGFMGGDKL